MYRMQYMLLSIQLTIKNQFGYVFCSRKLNITCINIFACGIIFLDLLWDFSPVFIVFRSLSKWDGLGWYRPSRFDNLLQNIIMWRGIWYKHSNGHWCELWEEIDKECNICLEEKCDFELSSPTPLQIQQLGTWDQSWMNSCTNCLNNISKNNRAAPFGPGESINETNIFF